MSGQRSSTLPRASVLATLVLLVSAGCAQSGKSGRPDSPATNNGLATTPKASPRIAHPEPFLASPSIGSFAVESMPALAQGQIALELVPPEIEPAGELVHRDAIARRERGLLVIDLGKVGPAGPKTAPEPYQACSFAIDCDDARVSALREASSGVDARKPSPVELRRFVSRHILHKNLAHGLVPASVAAELREGDCSEHALLLSAVSRLHGYAARPVFGIVLIRLAQEKWLAQGHAWTEIHSEGRWDLYDAAIVSEPAGAQAKPPPHSALVGCPLYIPLGYLSSEGPDFGYVPFLLNVHRVRVPSDGLVDARQCWIAQQ